MPSDTFIVLTSARNLKSTFCLRFIDRHLIFTSDYFVRVFFVKASESHLVTNWGKCSVLRNRLSPLNDLLAKFIFVIVISQFLLPSCHIQCAPPRRVRGLVFNAQNDFRFIGRIHERS